MSQQRIPLFFRSVASRFMVGLLLLAVFAGCEALFTTNLFENFARDPENMSEAQLVAYGNEAVASGDRDRMANAFNSLSEKVGDRDLSDDPETRNTLVELGLGATDIVSVVRDNIEDPTGVSVEDFDDERRAIARDTADIMLQADPEDFSPDRWAYAAAGVGLAALGDGEDWEDEDAWSDVNPEDADRVKGLLDNALVGYDDDSDTFDQIQRLRDQLPEG